MKKATLMGYCPSLLVMEQCLCFWSEPTRVLSRHVGSRATLEMKNYTLNILSSQITLPFSWFKTLWYSFLYDCVQPRKDEVDYFNTWVSGEARKFEWWINTSWETRPCMYDLTKSEKLEFYQCVSPSVVVATNTLQNLVYNWILEPTIDLTIICSIVTLCCIDKCQRHVLTHDQSTTSSWAHSFMKA